MKWYKRDPDAAISGMIGLTLEECGAYNIVIDLLYSRDGDLPADDHFFARALHCRPQVWRRVRDQLVAKGKLHYKTDGKLTANRVETELITARKLIDKMSLMGVVSAEKRKENKEATPTACELQPHPQPQPDKKERKRDATHLSAAFDPNRDFARQKGWPEARIDQEIERFRNHAAQNDRKCKNWDAAWRNWVTSPYQQAVINGASNVETDKDRAKRRSREALDKLRAYGEGRGSGDAGGEVVQLLPRSGAIGES